MSDFSDVSILSTRSKTDPVEAKLLKSPGRYRVPESLMAPFSKGRRLLWRDCRYWNQFGSWGGGLFKGDGGNSAVAKGK